MTETVKMVPGWRVGHNGLLLEGPFQMEEKPFYPAQTTDKEPPEAGENQVAVYDIHRGTWSLQHDYRGTRYWTANAQMVSIAQVGIQPPPDAITTPPPTEYHTSYDSDAETWLLDRDALQAYLLEAVEVEKHEAQLAGCTINDILWDTDDKAEVRYTQFMVMFGQNSNLEIPDFYPNADHHFTLTADIFTPAYQAMLHQVQSIFAWRTAKRAEIAAASTDDAMLALLGTVKYPFSKYNADGTVVV